MKKSPQFNQQTEPKQCKSEVWEICIYRNLESGRHQHLYLQINSGFHARKNPKQQYLKVVTFSDASFNKQHIYVYDHVAQIIHHHAIISCKNQACLFYRSFTIQNLPTVWINLTQVGGGIQHSEEDLTHEISVFVKILFNFKKKILA